MKQISLLLRLGLWEDRCQPRSEVKRLAKEHITDPVFATIDRLERDILKNVMMAGGLLQIAYFGAGAFSLDLRAKRIASGVVTESAS